MFVYPNITLLSFGQQYSSAQISPSLYRPTLPPKYLSPIIWIGNIFLPKFLSLIIQTANICLPKYLPPSSGPPCCPNISLLLSRQLIFVCPNISLPVQAHLDSQTSLLSFRLQIFAQISVSLCSGPPYCLSNSLLAFERQLFFSPIISPCSGSLAAQIFLSWYDIIYLSELVVWLHSYLARWGSNSAAWYLYVDKEGLDPQYGLQFLFCICICLYFSFCISVFLYLRWGSAAWCLSLSLDGEGSNPQCAPIWLFVFVFCFSVFLSIRWGRTALAHWRSLISLSWLGNAPTNNRVHFFKICIWVFVFEFCITVF